jgi:hypothetical protein
MSDVVVGWMHGSESGNGSLLKRTGIEQRVDIADGSPSRISKPGHWEIIHGIGRTMGNNRGKMSCRESGHYQPHCGTILYPYHGIYTRTHRILIIIIHVFRLQPITHAQIPVYQKN